MNLVKRKKKFSPPFTQNSMGEKTQPQDNMRAESPHTPDETQKPKDLPLLWPDALVTLLKEYTLPEELARKVEAAKDFDVRV